MPALIPSTPIRAISPLLISGPCCDDFAFSLQEVGPDTGWGSMGWPTFSLREGSTTLYVFDCMATSGMVVATDNQRGKFVASPARSDESPINAAMADLRAVVRAIGEERPLGLSPGLDDLLARASQVEGPPPNIEEWARQLAADICGLTD